MNLSSCCVRIELITGVLACLRLRLWILGGFVFEKHTTWPQSSARPCKN